MKKNKPSATAVIISKSIAYCSHHSKFKDYVDPVNKNLNFQFLSSAIGWRAKFYTIASKFFVTKFYFQFLEHLSVRGIKLHYILRKLKIEDIVNNSLISENSYQQIVIIGAGGDCLGLKLALKHKNLKIIEIDHPNTQTLKQKTVKSLDNIQIDNFILNPADLATKDLLSVLKEIKEFDFNRKTIFIAEGLFMYLPFEAVKNILNISNHFPLSSVKFIFTYMLPNKKGHPAFFNQTKLVDFWLKFKKEKLIWGATPSELNETLKEMGFIPGEHYNSEQLKSVYLNKNKKHNFKVALGENITFITN